MRTSNRAGPGTSSRAGPKASRVVALVLVGALAASCSAGGQSDTKGHAGSNTGTSGTAGTSGNTSAPSPGGTLTWKTCGAPFQCATLRVPLDYSSPADGTIPLALIRLPASQRAHRGGAVLVNPGGPGASGVDFLRNDYTLFSANLRAHFDIVGFDPRGVGASDPIRCENGPALEAFIALNPAPATPSAIATVVAATKQFDQSCLADSGKALLANVSTVDAARDMDQIRSALGEPKLNYLGFSYGTFLGATYAGLFPTHVRAMALDGALNPDQSFRQLDLQQAKGFEVDLQDFLAACESSPSCPLLQLANKDHTSVQGAFNQALARIESGTPVPTSSGGRTLSVGDGYLGIIAALYSSASWGDLDEGLAAVLQGDGTILLSLADQYNERQPNGSYSNELAANTAINCADYPAPTRLSTYEADAKSFAAQAPVFGASQGWAPLSCKYWPVPPTGSPHVIVARGAPPIVVVGTTADPATPYSGAQALAHQLTSGVLITHVGVGHTAYIDSACVRSAVDSYLIDLKVPPKGLACHS